MPKLHKVRSEGQPISATARARADAIIDMGTSVVVTGYSKGLWVPLDKSLLRVTATLMSAGTTATQLQVIKNGVGFDTMSIGAGQRFASVDVKVDFIANDIWQMYITVAGISATGLTFYGTFS